MCEEHVPCFRRGGDSGRYRGCEKTSSLCQFTQDTLTQGGLLTNTDARSFEVVSKYDDVISNANMHCILVGVHITWSVIK